MSHQQSNRAVLAGAAKRTDVANQLRRFLRKNGVRDTHSKRARAAINRAAVLPLTDKQKGRV